MVLADLTSKPVVDLANQVKKNCEDIPKPWPEPKPPKKELSQTETEKYARRDRNDMLSCADPALRYVDTITKRDQALTGKKK